MISQLARALRRRARWIIRRRAFYRFLRPTDIFVVTYPKSGTTWLAFLLANLLRPPGSQPLTLDTYLQHTPDVNGAYFGTDTLQAFGKLPTPRIFLAHPTYDPVLPRVIYVLRDPRDVLVSYWHHDRLTQRDFKLSLADFVRRDDHWPGRWDEHVSGWLLTHHHPRLLVVKYEDLQHDTVTALQHVVDFVGLVHGVAELRQAAEDSRFDRMRSAEEQFGWKGVRAAKDERFVRRGQAGGWRDELDEASVQAIQQKYGAVMRQVGYELSHIPDKSVTP